MAGSNPILHSSDLYAKLAEVALAVRGRSAGSSQGTRPLRLWTTIALLVLFAGFADAQFRPPTKPEVKLQATSRGPYYTGVPLTLQVEASGFDPDEGAPTSTPPTLQRGRLEFVGVSPRQSSFISTVNGRRTEFHSVTYEFTYRLHADEPGRYDLPPFVVQQGNLKLQTRPGRVSFEEIAKADNVRVRLQLPEKPIYVGQRVEVALEWWIGSSIRDKVHRYQFQVPLFEGSQPFKFVDEPVERGDNILTIETVDGDVQLAYTSDSRVVDGRTFVVIRALRTLIPLREGTFEPAPARVIVDEVVSYRRGVFGRRPAEIRKVEARDLSRKLVVKPVPTAQRPASFSGAIGVGFELDVSADRTVVQTGDLLKLTMKLTGSGLLETAGAPRLGASLPAHQFRQSGGQEIAGTIEEDTKTFVTAVRILDESLREIPPIEYAWFDPDLGEYRTTQSGPIALRVRRGTMITADDVEAASVPTNGASGTPESEAAEVQSGRPRFTLTGAELSLVDEPSRVLRSENQPRGGKLVLFGLYALPLALVALALTGRRLASRDPAQRKTIQRVEEELRKMEASRSLPAREAAAALASGLRAILAEEPGTLAKDVDPLVAACDAIVYAPAESSVELSAEIRDRVLEVARQARERVR